MFLIGTSSMAVDSVVCSKQLIHLLHFPDSVVHVRPCLYTSREIRT
jgi:hypothetical protein